jgi:hypothetical protein
MRAHKIHDSCKCDGGDGVYFRSEETLVADSMPGCYPQRQMSTGRMADHYHPAEIETDAVRDQHR